MKYARSPVMIFAGGTGGHVFPALAVAEKITQQSTPVVWVGTKKGIESRVVVDAGYQIEWILVNGLRGKGVTTYLLAPVTLTLAGLQTIWLLFKHRPCAVLGMGGFVAGPGGLISVLLRKPLIIHEQNAIAGLTNRVLAPFAKRILTAFPNVFARRNVALVGNPVRTEILQIHRQHAVAEPINKPLRVLVTGGSLGAQVFNKVVPAALAQIPLEERPQVWHQSGEHKLKFTEEKYKIHAVVARVDAFIDSIHDAYAWADLVICRAGAITVAELAIAGVGAVFVPYPYAVDDHQTANAKALASAGAACLIQERDLTDTGLTELLREFSINRLKLKRIADAVRSFAKPLAADDVARVCLQVCLEKKSWQG